MCVKALSARCHRAWGLLSIAAATSITSAAAYAADRPDAELFTRPAMMHSVVLSPQGRRVALALRGIFGYMNAQVSDIETMGQPRVVAAYRDAGITWIDWISDDRLVYTAVLDNPRPGASRYVSFAVDHDGKNRRQLTVPERVAAGDAAKGPADAIPADTWSIYRLPHDGSEDVLIRREHRDASREVIASSLARLDTRNGEVTTLDDGVPPGTTDWLLDRQGQPRMLVVSHPDGIAFYRRQDEADGQWRWMRLNEQALPEGDAFIPISIETPEQAVVLTSADRDTQALRVYNLHTGLFEPEPIAALQSHDIDGAVIDLATGHVVGAKAVTDRPTTLWFTDRLARIQSDVNASLPADRSNLIECRRCESDRYFVIRSSSDRSPPEVLIYDDQERKLHSLGRTRPWIRQNEQAARTAHRILARDGLPIPVVVTHPPGSAADQPLPTVIVAHGGPWLRGADSSWNAEAAFLASRGWRVIEPEFRGSAGFGQRHLRAGRKALGTTMIDDLKDTLDWAVAEKLSDPARVCVYGGSYGGYAALMSVIRHPQAYRCAASLAGYTDLVDWLQNRREVLPPSVRRVVEEDLIGDPVHDRALLDISSPRRRADEIRVPVLVAHGREDERVPTEHAVDFARAAKRAGVAVTLYEYHGEGHGWTDRHLYASFLERLETFIRRAFAATPSR